MRIHILLLFVVGAIGCNGSVPPPPPDKEVDEVVMELHRLHAAVRPGLKTRLDDRCVQAARKHAEWMARTGQLTHWADGAGVGDRLAAEGYRWSRVGENIARGYSSPQAVFDAWMRSNGHRRNIKNTGYEDLGLAYADGPRGRFWCVVFGRQGTSARANSLDILQPPGLDAEQEAEKALENFPDPEIFNNLYPVGGGKSRY